ncbi:alginate lyase [Streptomyces antioxidans]|uniref:Alginate lyase n=1 Tax=Streptomyces antioxidans TaxID=1507734 RepID=A0A1V4D4Z6_9ACTN|nr:alginate lyase family protein [Streptomyces antioxidans]OPF79430.1 alginate lyase [Streptomyces antioxidans]
MGAPPAGRGRIARAIVTASALLAVLAIPAAPSAQGAERVGQSGPVPRTVVLDGARLSLTKLKLQLGDRDLRRTVRDLTTQADQWMEQGPWTVTDKDQVPPSGDKHDYFSQAPYFWPTQPKTDDNPYGCPYVQKDGQRNPDVDKMTDRPEVGKVFESAYELSLAWYYTGERAYAEHAADILRTWFVSPATRMNPNLNHAQFIPCMSDGRSIGIIDFSQAFTSLLDAAALLDTGAPGWTESDHAGFRTWNEQFLDWLVNSDFGKEEGATENNHGTFYDMQVAAIATAVGDRDRARQVLRDARTKRIDTQIAADGTQPQELERTRSFHYSTFNLVAYVRMAAIGKQIGVDLWHYTGSGGANLFKAVDVLLPAATGAEPWPYPELDFRAYAASDIVHAAADAGDRKARAALPKLQPPPGGDLWALRPAVEQLDSIAQG